MWATWTVLLLILLAAPGWITGCSRVQATGHQESAPPYVSPDISQEALNSLIRQNSPKVQPTPEPRLWAHEVRHRRETFFSIALWYTGSGANWPRLVKANPDIDPRRIHIGDTVLIPEQLLKTRRPMPAGFPNPKRKHRTIKKDQPQRITPPSQNNEPLLFGPIENDVRDADSQKTDLPVPLETLD
jgi:hypothetical protein